MVVPRRILLVHPDPEMKDSLQELLDEIIEEGVIVHPEPDQKRAEKYLTSESCDLVLAHADIPNDRKALGDARRSACGIELLRSLRQSGKRAPFVLIASTPGAAFEVQGFEQVRLVRDGTKLHEDLKENIPALLQPVQGEEHRVELDISLDLDTGHPLWQLSVRKGHDLIPGPMEPLSVNNEELREILQDSQELSEQFEKRGFDENDDAWKRRLRHIGRDLEKAIFKGNPKLVARFHEYLGQTGREAARIRFTVAKEIYPVVLEAILDTADEKFWMLKAPVYRRLIVEDFRHPLFSDPDAEGRRLNCLIIEAKVTGYVKSVDRQFEDLDSVGSEAAWLENFLKTNQSAFRIGDVVRIFEPKAGCSFEETVHDTLIGRTGSAGDAWDLVHFAGHSYYDAEGEYRDVEGKGGKKNTGYFLLPKVPPNPGDPAKWVNAETFAKWLQRAGARFLYLSSCRSSEEAFVFELAQRMVPAVVGFRWQIADKKAREYTEAFYTHLFEKRSLESAFFLARRDMEEDSPNDPIWASAVLIVQVPVTPQMVV